jgi:hypothetical protein
MINTVIFWFSTACCRLITGQHRLHVTHYLHIQDTTPNITGELILLIPLTISHTSVTVDFKKMAILATLLNSALRHEDE